MSGDDKKLLGVIVGIILATYGITRASQNQFASAITILLGAYLIIKGFE